MSNGVFNTIIHGIIRVVPVVGQTYAKPSVSAPILIGNKGGIIVEGISTNAPSGSVTDTDTNVTNVSATIMAANPNRNSNMIQNNGSMTIFLGFDGAAAVANTGVTIYPNTTWEPNVVFQGDVTAITSAGICRVTVLES